MNIYFTLLHFGQLAKVMIEEDQAEGTDHKALEEGYVSSSCVYYFSIVLFEISN